MDNFKIHYILSGICRLTIHVSTKERDALNNIILCSQLATQLG